VIRAYKRLITGSGFLFFYGSQKKCEKKNITSIDKSFVIAKFYDLISLIIIEEIASINDCLANIHNFMKEQLL
jgi:hypothetical protein